MPDQFLSTVSVLTGFICLVMAVFLLVTPTRRRLPNILFAGFLLLTAIDVTSWAWMPADPATSWFHALRSSLGALQMPFFVGFIAASCFADFRIDKTAALHALPFVFALVLTLPGDQLPFGPDDVATGILETRREAFTEFIISQVQYYLYIAIAIGVLVRFRNIFRDHYSDTRIAVFNWLVQLVGVSLFAHTLVVVRGFLAFADRGPVFTALQGAGAIIVLAVITWITLKALLQPELFRGIDGTLAPTPIPQTIVSLPVKTDHAESNRLQDFMEQQAPYLDADLTLAKLARELKMPGRELSELINQRFGIHFFDFVNRYRIEHAQRTLLEHPKKSVLQILYEVGFNSKSSFNTAFRKHTQTTPTAFRRAHAGEGLGKTAQK